MSKNRIRVALAAALTLLASFGVTAFAATSAQASTPHCMSSKLNYNDNFFHRVPTVSASNNSHQCLLSAGDRGEGVRTLQWVLNKCNGASLSLDEQFGPATKAALQKVQRAAGVADDGIYGQDTRDILKWAMYRDDTFVQCAVW